MVQLFSYFNCFPGGERQRQGQMHCQYPAARANTVQSSCSMRLRFGRSSESSFSSHLRRCPPWRYYLLSEHWPCVSAFRIRFAAPAFNLVAILIVLVLISRMPTELPNTGSHIHSQGRYRECQVSTSRTPLTSLHASSPSSIPIPLPLLNRLLLPTYRKHWQFIRTLLSIFSPPWEHYHQCAHRYHYHIPHPGNDNYQISMERCSIISSGGYDHVLIPTIVELVRSHRSTDNHQHILAHYPVGNNTLVCFWCCRLWFRPWP